MTMAIRGPRPVPATIRALHGGKKSDATDKPNLTRRATPLESPRRLTKRQQQLWDRYIEPAWWLADCDTPIAYEFVMLMDEMLSGVRDMNTARLAEMRKASNELHLSSSEQARMGIETSAADPAEAFFDR